MTCYCNCSKGPTCQNPAPTTSTSQPPVRPITTTQTTAATTTVTSGNPGTSVTAATTAGTVGTDESTSATIKSGPGPTGSPTASQGKFAGILQLVTIIILVIFFSSIAPVFCRSEMITLLSFALLFAFI